VDNQNYEYWLTNWPTTCDELRPLIGKDISSVANELANIAYKTRGTDHEVLTQFLKENSP